MSSFSLVWTLLSNKIWLPRLQDGYSYSWPYRFLKDLFCLHKGEIEPERSKQNLPPPTPNTKTTQNTGTVRKPRCFQKRGRFSYMEMNCHSEAKFLLTLLNKTLEVGLNFELWICLWHSLLARRRLSIFSVYRWCTLYPMCLSFCLSCCQLSFCVCFYLPVCMSVN